MPTPPALSSLISRSWIAFQERRPLTFDEPVGELPVVADAQWSADLTGNSWGALGVWILLLILLQLAGWPLAKSIFTRFPDRGWSMTRIMTILLAGYVTWVFASLQVIRFQAIWAGVAVLLVAILSILALRFRSRNAVRQPIHRNVIAVSAEGIFWAVFGLFLTYRLINPDSYHRYWGGEKPMEFAHINAILRSAHFPPVDPWYSGGFINYYYYGTYLVAFLIKLTGIPVEYAFNLAQPTFPALLSSGSFGLAAALGKRMTGSTFGAWLAGLLGMIFVQFSGNLVTAARLVSRAVDGAPPVDGWGYWVWSPTRALPSPDRGVNITEFPYFGALYADLHPHVIAMPFTILILALAWQLASSWRSIPLVNSRRQGLRESLIPIAAPLLLTALALASLFMINAWDMPMFAIIAAVGILMVTAGLRSVRRRALVAGGMVLAVAGLAWILALPFTMHYVALFGEIASVRDETPLLGIQSHVGAPLLLVTLGAGALLLPRSTFSRGTQVAIATAMPITLGFFLVMQWIGIRAGGGSPTIAEAGVVFSVVGIWLVSAWSATPMIGGDARHRAWALKVATGIVGLITVIFVGSDRPTIALYAGIGLSAGLLWLMLTRPSEQFVMMAVAGAALLGASLEMVYLVDDLSGTDWYRMNTIFKFYNQVWNLLGVAAGVLAGRALWDILVHTSEPREGIEDAPARLFSWVTAAILLPLTLATLAYPVMATPVRLDMRFAGGNGPTLDAYAWMDYGEIPLFRVDEDGRRAEAEPLRYADDRAAIDWLNENVHGSPVIAEAAFGTYRCNGSRFSINTGLPAVIGWQRHQQQQRYLDDLAERENALRELYTQDDQARQLAIIEQFDVEYVIVGQTEWHYPSIDGNDCIDTGSPEAIASLEALEGDRLDTVFESGSTTIYRVIGD
jgi:YYY domain-containing protein